MSLCLLSPFLLFFEYSIPLPFQVRSLVDIRKGREASKHITHERERETGTDRQSVDIAFPRVFALSQ